MALLVSPDLPTIVIRRAAYERSGIARHALDERLGLTDDEFRVEGDLIAIGPLPAAVEVVDVVQALEDAGLRYYDEFFELSGNWPEWLRLFVAGSGDSRA